jgi:hypothetical protein
VEDGYLLLPLLEVAGDVKRVREWRHIHCIFVLILVLNLVLILAIDDLLVKLLVFLSDEFHSFGTLEF